jgi:uncharacterized protein with GYD domain
MNTFFLFGRYTEQAVKEISPKRTEKTSALVQKLGGQLKSAYALLGDHDLVLIVDLPGIEQAIQCSLALSKMTSISFTTAPAMPVEQFDKLATNV